MSERRKKTPKNTRTVSINEIFDLLHKKLPYADKLTELEVIERKAEESPKIISKSEEIRIGRASEQRVYQSVIELDKVLSAEITGQYSAEDKKMIDIIVYLKGVEEVSAVRIQVKSSYERIEEAHEVTKKIHGLFSEDELFQWLRERRYIFVNGALPKEEIQKAFLIELQQIIQYHKIKAREERLKAEEEKLERLVDKVFETIKPPTEQPDELFEPVFTQELAQLFRSLHAVRPRYKHLKAPEEMGIGYICTAELTLKDCSLIKVEGFGLKKIDAQNEADKKVLELIREKLDLLHCVGKINYQNILYEYKELYKPDVSPQYYYTDITDQPHLGGGVASIYLEGLEGVFPMTASLRVPSKSPGKKMVARAMLEKLGILPALNSPLRQTIAESVGKLKPVDYRRRIVELINSRDNAELVNYEDIKVTLFKKSTDVMVDRWTKDAIYRTRRLLKEKEFELLYSEREKVYWIAPIHARNFSVIEQF